jgi:hypothetical protein
MAGSSLLLTSVNKCTRHYYQESESRDFKFIIWRKWSQAIKCETTAIADFQYLHTQTTRNTRYSLYLITHHYLLTSLVAGLRFYLVEYTPSGIDKSNLEWLEQLFRQTVGNEREIRCDDFKKIVISKNVSVARKLRCSRLSTCSLTFSQTFLFSSLSLLQKQSLTITTLSACLKLKIIQSTLRELRRLCPTRRTAGWKV